MIKGPTSDNAFNVNLSPPVEEDETPLNPVEDEVGVSARDREDDAFFKQQPPSPKRAGEARSQYTSIPTRKERIQQNDDN